MHPNITINGKPYTAEEASLLKDQLASEYGEDSDSIMNIAGFSILIG